MAVSLSKNSNIKEAVGEVLSGLGVSIGKRVFIKPNLCGREPIKPGENSSIEVMDALIGYLKEWQCEIIIGHDELLSSEENFVPFDRMLEMAGYDKYKAMDGVRIINIDKLARTRVQLNGMTLDLPLDFLKNEVDTYINLAKVKTHMETTISFSLKNQMGLPLLEDRKEMHKGNLEKLIAEMALHMKPHISILEAYPAMDKNGPHHGRARELNFMAAGDDMVELDSFVAHLLGYDPEQIVQIKHARELGVGQMFDTAQMGKYSEFIVGDFAPAQKVFGFGKRLFGYPCYSCSQCILAVDAAGREFKKRPWKYIGVIHKAFFSKKNINIVFGNADELDLPPEDRFICVGDCAKKFAESHNVEFLPGCPPTVDGVRNYIVRKIKEQK